MSRVLFTILAVFALLGAGQAHSLDADRSISQFKHTRWTLEDNAPAYIRAISQAADGYLLLGANDGLYRFDGVKFEFLPRPGSELRNNAVMSMIARRNGEVWINYRTGAVGVYRDGSLSELPGARPGGAAYFATEDVDGGVWIDLSGGNSRLARFARGEWELVGDERGYNNQQVGDLLAARDGTLWVATPRTITFLPKGEQTFRLTGEVLNRGSAIAQDASGRIWVSDNLTGTRRLPDYQNGAEAAVSVRGYTPTVTDAARHILFDRDGSLWGATEAHGIFRIAKPDPRVGEPGLSNAPGEETFGYEQGLTSDITLSLFEDREGNIWVGTTMGLDMFRAANIVTETAIQPRSNFGYQTFQAQDGTVFAADSANLYRVESDRAPEIVFSGVNNPEAICESQDGSIYLAMHDDMVRFDGKRVSHVRTPQEHVNFTGCARDAAGAFWYTVGSDGVARLEDHAWSHFPLPPDRLNEWSEAVEATPDGIVAFFNTKGLLRIDRQPWTLLAAEKDIGIGQIATLYSGRDGLLIGGRYGLARLHSGKIETISSEGKPWLQGIHGIAQGGDGNTWLIGDRGLVRTSTASLDAALADPSAPLDVDLFDMNDGLPGPPTESRNTLTIGGDGRLWIATTEAVAWLDPSRLRRNLLPPPVVIASMTVGEQVIHNPRRIALDPGTDRLEIGYAALSLSIPERVRFRYRLNGVDRDWVDAGTRRTAFYTKLGPGEYTFQIIASNNDGVWNETGATLSFTIQPTFLQSPVFIVVCVLAAAVLLWMLYALRVRQVSKEMRRRLEERIGERERIARELHDTLLQGFQGLMLRFQAATDAIPANSSARLMMETAMDQADNVIIEGRDRVRDLRSSRVDGDLAKSLSGAAARHCQDGVRIVTTEEGEERPLHPAVMEEALRIGEEALANAGRHSAASTIEIQLAYHPDHLRLCIRDNGVGIDAAVVDAGRSGHFGLVGMRERADRICAQLTIQVQAPCGTEVVLTVPAGTAYRSAKASLWSNIVERLSTTGPAK